LHYSASLLGHHLLLGTPVTLLDHRLTTRLLERWAGKLTAVLLPGYPLLLLLLQPQLLLMRLQDGRVGHWSHHLLLLLLLLPVSHVGYQSHLRCLLTHVALLAVSHGLIHLGGYRYRLAVTHGLHGYHVRQRNLLAADHGLYMAKVLRSLAHLLAVAKDRRWCHLLLLLLRL
jgi:hypothetical protein